MINNNSGSLSRVSAISGKTVAVFAVVSLALALAVVYMLTPYGAALSPDSIFYLDIAAHIHQGQGLKSTDYSLANVGQNLAVANASWPPLYSILLAVTSFSGPSLNSAALLSALLLATTLFFLQLILCRFLSWQVALLASLPIMVTVPIITVHVFAWSEQLFIALLVMLFWATQTYLCTDDQKMGRRKLLIASIGLISALVFYTRYIGIIYMPLLPLLYVVSGRPRNLRALFIGSSMGAAAAIAALMAYNFHVSGSVTGAMRGAAKSSLFSQLDALLSALNPVFFDATSAPVVIAIALLAAAVLVYFASRQEPVHASGRTAFSITAKLSLTAALYYLACIAVLRSVVAFDAIDVRLVSATLPFLWLGCVGTLASTEIRLSKSLAGFVAAFVMAAMVAQGYLALLAVRRDWREEGSPHLAMTVANSFANFNLPPFANSYRASFSPLTDASSVLVVDRPHIIHQLTGLTCVARPSKLSVADLRKLAELPPRSYMIVPSSALPAVLDSFRQYNISLDVTPTDDGALIHLPIALDSANLPAN